MPGPPPDPICTIPLFCKAKSSSTLWPAEMPAWAVWMDSQNRQGSQRGKTHLVNCPAAKKSGKFRQLSRWCSTVIWDFSFPFLRSLSLTQGSHRIGFIFVSHTQCPLWFRRSEGQRSGPLPPLTEWLEQVQLPWVKTHCDCWLCLQALYSP